MSREAKRRWCCGSTGCSLPVVSRSAFQSPAWARGSRRLHACRRDPARCRADGHGCTRGRTRPGGLVSTRLVLSLLIGVTAVLTIRFMPIRLPGEPSFDEGQPAPDSARKPRTAVVAAAALAGGAATPFLAGVGAFFFLLAILAGWLFGLSVRVILRSRGVRGSLNS